MSEKDFRDLIDLNTKCPQCNHTKVKHLRTPPSDPSRWRKSTPPIPWICEECRELKLPDCKYYMNKK